MKISLCCHTATLGIKGLTVLFRMGNFVKIQKRKYCFTMRELFFHNERAKSLEGNVIFLPVSREQLKLEWSIHGKIQHWYCVNVVLMQCNNFKSSTILSNARNIPVLVGLMSRPPRRSKRSPPLVVGGVGRRVGAGLAGCALLRGDESPSRSSKVVD